MHVFKTQNRVHLCHVLSSSLLFPSGRPLHTQMLQPHLFKACKILLFTNHHLTMEQDPTPHPRIKAFTEGKGLALPTEGCVPVWETTGPLSLLCCACEGPPIYVTLEAITTHKCCPSQSRLAPPLPFQHSISKSSDATHPTLLLPGS